MDMEIIDKKTATENSAAFSDWTQKLRFDRSFTAKLILADQKVKEYYAEIATALLRFDKVKSKTVWSGVAFNYGKNRVAYIAINGKTLCLYIALDPQEISDGKYKAKDVGEIKKRAKTPSMLRIKSDGGKRNALKIIALLADKIGLIEKQEGIEPVDPSNFKTDSFNNLITRGLIRILRKNIIVKNGEEIEDGEERSFGKIAAAASDAAHSSVYSDTSLSLDELLSRHGIYNDILSSFSDGSGKVRFSEKAMLRSVDEMWVKAIEDCLSSIDELIRNPRRYIAETEEVLPIELTKRISGRSIAHLCRHTDYISSRDDEEIVPTKMLNVFREDSILTYENKFLNTLINRLYLFVNKRYKIARDRGIDEKLQSFEFENSFEHGDGKGRIKIIVDYSERATESDVKNTFFGSGLWARVERLNDIVTAYSNSSFVKSMERNFVRPPILRTNAILKNKYFRECLALWEFIESYSDAGYGITINEKVMDVSDAFVKESYANAAIAYFLFRHHIENGFGEEETFSSAVVPGLVAEKVAEPEKYTEDFAVDEEEVDSVEGDIELAIKVALLADETLELRGDYADEFDENGLFIGGKTSPFWSGYSRTFHAKIRLAEENTKENYVAICNDLFKYNKVKLRESRRYATFNAGKNILARVTTSEKTLKFYLALNISDVAEKYNALDVSDKTKFADTPVCVKVRSKRSLKFAFELISLLAEKYGLETSKKELCFVAVDNYVVLPFDEMLEKGWIVKVKRKSSLFIGKKIGENSIEVENNIPFGVVEDDTAKENAQIVANLSVVEPDIPVGNVLDEAAITMMPEKSDVNEKKIVDLDDLVRPESDYSKPTKYGLDDSSGFINDEKTAILADNDNFDDKNKK